jgi:hypothetical protein
VKTCHRDYIQTIQTNCTHFYHKKKFTNREDVNIPKTQNLRESSKGKIIQSDCCLKSDVKKLSEEVRGTGIRKNYDPKEAMKLSRLRTDQLETLGLVELCIAVFSLAMSQFSWRFEWEEKYNGTLLGPMLDMQMCCGGILVAVIMLKKKIQLLRLIAVNEVRAETRIFEFFPV